MVLILAAMSGWNHDATRRDRKHIYVCSMVKRPNDAEQCEIFSHPAGKCATKAFTLRSEVMLLLLLRSLFLYLSRSRQHIPYIFFLAPSFNFALSLALSFSRSLFLRSLSYSSMLSIQFITQSGPLSNCHRCRLLGWKFVLNVCVRNY